MSTLVYKPHVLKLTTCFVNAALRTYVHRIMESSYSTYLKYFLQPLVNSLVMLQN